LPSSALGDPDGLPSGLVEGDPGAVEPLGAAGWSGPSPPPLFGGGWLGSGVGAGFGWLGLALGGAVPDSPSHENATIPPSGMFRDPAPSELNVQLEASPSDHHSPQKASAGAVFTHGSLVGTPLTRQTKPGWREA
jgi:hypothetical protein